MIETNDLSKNFDDFKAVNGVTLKVKPGQILTLLGQNGAGKTTTVRMLTALLNPTRGSARVNGYDVIKQAASVRASVGVLTEQHGLYVRMTAREYLDFFGEVYRLDSAARDKRKKYLLEYFGLAEVADKRVGEYSKGMRQKLALARALMHEPPVLLLDEPTSAMDPESARLVRDEIARLKSSQRTIVICTHNLAEAEALADIIAIIYRGKILLSGTLDELKQQLLGPVEYEATLSQPWQLGGVSLPKGVELRENNGSRLRFRVERPQETNPLLLRQLTDMQAPVVTLQEVSRSLEQVYLKAMADAQAPLDARPLNVTSTI
ncbi:MAG: ABC transporter ATP-binding protein [Anaerolineales bacterium]